VILVSVVYFTFLNFILLFPFRGVKLWAAGEGRVVATLKIFKPPSQVSCTGPEPLFPSFSSAAVHCIYLLSPIWFCFQIVSVCSFCNGGDICWLADDCVFSFSMCLRILNLYLLSIYIYTGWLSLNGTKEKSWIYGPRWTKNVM
jgi:hypothetical protein